MIIQSSSTLLNLPVSTIRNACPKSSLLDCFPGPEGTLTQAQLANTLKKYTTFILLAQEAIKNFQKRVMPYFDPLVGENACQIRAAFFAEIINKQGIDDTVQAARKQLEDLFVIVSGLLDHKLRGNESFSDLLKRNDALLELPADVLAIISSYVLSETKTVSYKSNSYGVPSRQEVLSYKDLGNKKGLTGNFAQAIIKIAQVKLSELSVNYIQGLAQQFILNKEYEGASKLVFGKHIKLDERHRRLSPFFPTMRLLLKGMHNAKIPLILKVKFYVKGNSYSYRASTFVFENQGENHYSFTSRYAHPFPKGAVFFHAISIREKEQSLAEFETRLLRQDITDLILAAAADHPQYGCEDQHAPCDPEREEYRAFAHEWGTCHDNPSLFMVEHVCCDMIDLDEQNNLVQNIYLSARQNAADLYKTICEDGEFSWFRLRLIGEKKVIPVARLFKNFSFESKNPLNLTYGTLIWAMEFRENPTQRIYPNRRYKIIIHD